MLVSESGKNQNCNFLILTVRIGRRIRKTQAKIGTAMPILDRFRSDSDALVLEHQIRLVSDSETMMLSFHIFVTSIGVHEVPY